MTHTETTNMYTLTHHFCQLKKLWTISEYQSNSIGARKKMEETVFLLITCQQKMVSC